MTGLYPLPPDPNAHPPGRVQDGRHIFHFGEQFPIREESEIAVIVRRALNAPSPLYMLFQNQQEAEDARTARRLMGCE